MGAVIELRGPRRVLAAVRALSAGACLSVALLGAPGGHVLSFGMGTRNRTGAALFNALSFGGDRTSPPAVG
ncbi:MAG: hypothetical protein ABI488_21085 [Polyangiaceae bacterium]